LPAPPPPPGLGGAVAAQLGPAQGGPGQRLLHGVLGVLEVAGDQEQLADQAVEHRHVEVLEVVLVPQAAPPARWRTRAPPSRSGGGSGSPGSAQAARTTNVSSKLAGTRLTSAATPAPARRRWTSAGSAAGTRRVRPTRLTGSPALSRAVKAASQLGVRTSAAGVAPTISGRDPAATTRPPASTTRRSHCSASARWWVVTSTPAPCSALARMVSHSP